MEFKTESMDWEQSSLKTNLSEMKKFDANSNQTHPLTSMSHSADNSSHSSASPDREQGHSDSEVSPRVRKDPIEGFRSSSPSLANSNGDHMTPMNLTKSSNRKTSSPMENFRPVPSIPSSGLPTMIPMNLAKTEQTKENKSRDHPVPSIPSTGLPTMIPMNLVKTEPHPKENKTNAHPVSGSHRLTTPTGTTTKAKSTKSGSKKSFVWRYFQHPKLEDGSADKTRTQCLLCNNQLAFNASGTTTTMLNHLKSRHSDIADTEEHRRRQTKVPTSGQANSRSTGGKGSSKASSLGINGVCKSEATNNGADSSWTSMATTEGPGGKANATSASKKKQDVIRSLLKGDIKQEALAHCLVIESSKQQQHINGLSQNSGLVENSFAVQKGAGHNSPAHTGSHSTAFSSIDVPSGGESASPVTPAKLNGLSLTSFLPPASGSHAAAVSSSLTATDHNQSAAALFGAAGVSTGELGKKMKSPCKRKRQKPTHLPSMDGRKRVHLDGEHIINSHDMIGQYACEDGWSESMQRQFFNHNSTNDMDVIRQFQYQQQQARSKAEASSDRQLCPDIMAEAIAFFLVRDLYPIGILAGEGFRTLMRKLVPAVRSPDVETMRRHILPKIYKKAENKLMTEFRQSEVTGASLSLEIWSRENKYYASIKVHYLDNQMRDLKSKLLKTKEINAQVLCSELLLENYSNLGLTGIPGPCPVVVNNPEPLLDELDNAVIPDIQERFMVIPCLVSCLSDALKSGFNLQEVVSLVTRCRGLDDSPDSVGNEFNPEECWLGAYATLRQMAADYPEIKQKYSLSVSYEHMLLSTEEEELLDKLVPVIENIKQTLETISNGSLFMTASMIKPVICNLRKKQLGGMNGLASSASDVIGCSAHSPSLSSSDVIDNGGANSIVVPPVSHGTNGNGFAGEVVSQFKAAVWHHLCQFYQESGSVHNTLWIATLVDPRFKRSYESHAANNDERAAIIKLLKDEVGESDSSMDSTDRPENSDLQQVFGQEYFSSASNSEVDRYLQEAPISLKDNPLQWWSANNKNFPRVAEVARRYLCIPVTSVSTNRNFSTDDFSTSINTKRASIDQEDLDTYLFLSHNWQL